MDNILMTECPECHKILMSNLDSCPNCGYPIKKNTVQTFSGLIKKNRKTVGIMLLMLSTILIIAGILKITQDSYKTYQDNYVRCLEGYNDVMNSSKSYKYGSYFRSSYESIAEKYKEKMDEDIQNLWKIRITTLVLCSVGIFLGTAGIHFMKGEKT